MVVLYMSKAFDTMNIDILLKKIESFSCLAAPEEMAGQLYLRGRWTYVDFRSKKSKLRKSKQGVPQ